MTQLIINIEDTSLLTELKQAIKMLRGVGTVSVIEHQTESAASEITLQAMKDAQSGNTVKCVDFEDYLRQIK